MTHHAIMIAQLTIQNTQYLINTFTCHSLSLSSLYQFDLVFTTHKPLDYAHCIDKNAQLILGKTSTFHGTITTLKGPIEISQDKNNYVYTAVLSSPFYCLRSNVRFETFIKKTLPDIIKELLSRHINAIHVQFILKNSHCSNELTNQYEESDLDFIVRLLERENINVTYESDNDSFNIVLSDTLINKHSHTLKLNYSENMVPDSDSAWHFTSLYTPHKKSFSIKTTQPTISPGDKIILEQSQYTAINVSHHYDRHTHNSLYYNKISLIPHTQPYTLPHTIPTPVAGYELATIDASHNSTDINPAGEYLIRFSWDKKNPKGHASPRLKLLTPSAGDTELLHGPLQPGTQIVCGFIKGNPDHPIIIGTLPSEACPSVTTCHNATQNTLSTGMNQNMILDDGYKKAFNSTIHT